MGLSLPLAVLLGYFVAEPMELGSMAVVVFVLVVLAIPLMMKWYYPLLVLAWNAAFSPVFLPGRPALWASWRLCRPAVCRAQPRGQPERAVRDRTRRSPSPCWP